VRAGLEAPVRHSQTADATLDAIHAKAFALGRAFTPLTLPMTIDAGSFPCDHRRSKPRAFVQACSDSVARRRHWCRHHRAVHSADISLCSASQPMDWTHGHDCVVRLSAFIMVCIGVSITWNGVRALLAEVGVSAH